RAERAPVARDARRVAYDVPRDPDPARLVILVVPARVADVRRGLHHHLTVVTRVGERLLITGHAGREDRLAERQPFGAVRLTGAAAAVLEHEDRWAAHENLLWL